MILRGGGVRTPRPPSGSAHALEHPTYIGGGVGGGGGVSVIQKTLNREGSIGRKCLDAFYNDSRGRKQNLLVKR